MTIEEAIKVIQTERECVMRQCDRGCAKCDLVMKDNEITSAYDMAISALCAKQEAKKNEPLTLDELKEMVGEWVWIQYHGNDPHYEGWAHIYNPLWCHYLGKDVPMNLGSRCLTFYRYPPKASDIRHDLTE